MTETVCILTGDFDTKKYPIPPKRVRRSAKQCVHTPMPEGYSARREWAEQAIKTHSQVQCPRCGLWAIWLPKAEAKEIRKQDNAKLRAFSRAYQREAGR